MIDAYETLFKKYPKEEFFNDGIAGIITAPHELIQSHWEAQKNKLFNNGELYIRGYGRDALGTAVFLLFYQFLFENSNIRKDPSNNHYPSILLRNLTKRCKITKADANGFERIQNYQVSHLFGRTKNPLLFTAAWNIAYVPKYLDPFTGHETQGDDSLAFKKLFQEKFSGQFEYFIADYNKLLDTEIHLERIEESIEKTREKLRKSRKDFSVFTRQMLSQWSKI